MLAHGPDDDGGGRSRSISVALGTLAVLALLVVGWALTELRAGPVGTWAVRGVVALAIAGLVHRWLTHLQTVRQREARVRRAHEQLRTQREVLIQTISHEFRTPLAIIQGAAETLIERDGLARQQRRALLLSLRNAAHRLTDVTSAVLAIAEPLDHDAQELIDLEAVVTDLTEELERLRAADRVALARDEDADSLVSDPNRVRLIVRALLENGLRFSALDQPVEVATTRDGLTFSLRVRDHGQGMTDELVARAFDPLVQGDGSVTREHGGLGLGLFAARQATVQLGGDIELVSRDDGVDVVIQLPQRRDSDRQRRPRDRTTTGDLPSIG